MLDDSPKPSHFFSSNPSPDVRYIHVNVSVCGNHVTAARMQRRRLLSASWANAGYLNVNITGLGMLVSCLAASLQPQHMFGILVTRAHWHRSHHPGISTCALCWDCDLAFSRSTFYKPFIYSHGAFSVKLQKAGSHEYVRTCNSSCTHTHTRAHMFLVCHGHHPCLHSCCLHTHKMI